MTWHKPKSAHDMAQEGGQEFLDYYLNGLPHSSNATLDKFGKLLTTYTLGALPPQTYSLDQWMQLLMAHGPLAILVDAPPDGDHYTHILVLQGIEWQTGFADAIFHIVDPAGGAVVPAAASVVQQRLDANDVVQLSIIKGWYSL
jgi:hypothetical protein